MRGLGDEPLRAVFIRAPWIERRATGSRCSPRSTAIRSWRAQRNMLVAAFHPELTDDLRLHALFLALRDGRPRGRASERGGVA